MNAARELLPAVVLANGRVLVEGGFTVANCGTTTATSELFDPATNTWRPTGSLANARGYQTAVRQSNGGVRTFGGISTNTGVGADAP